MMLSIASRVIAALSGREASGVEARLRGRFYRDCSGGAEIRVGRGVELVGRRNIRFGAGVVLYGATYFNANGTQGRITIGDRTRIDRNCVLYGQGGLSIGADCAIAAGVIVYTQTNQYRRASGVPVTQQPVDYAPVRIADHVWVGAGAIVLPGVSVGEHSVVGAGAVVTRDVAPGAVVAGVPAREIGARRDLSSLS